jgi:4-amino-4-deoxy-L-arabinose transferase-like glycosyltransferase
MSDAALATSRSLRLLVRGACLGLVAFTLSLFGTELLRDESLRPWAVLLLVTAAVLAVLSWSNVPWVPSFPPEQVSEGQRGTWRNRVGLAILAGAVLLAALAHVAFLAAPRHTFGAAGWLWLAAIAVLIIAAALSSAADGSYGDQTDRQPAWTSCEVVLLAAITLLALVLRLWNLRDVPFNIYPDEVMTGVVAEHAYINGSSPAPSLFSTLWGDVELPALWFGIVAAVLKVGGVGLATVRLPPALFGAATVLPFYGLLRSVWGRIAAIAGASIMAFSAANVHYSRMALNNITTPFFWTLCFFFLIRGLRNHRQIDWTLAGLAAGVSEYFYYGTRLLPFILIAFIAYLLVIHWPRARHYVKPFGWLLLGYLIGFGPLLSYFLAHPGLYYGRGAGLMTWRQLPVSWHDSQQMWRTLWPIMSENLLGISTHSAQDIMYYAPLLLKAEAALLVLGVALLVWRWRHPGAFLMLLSGVGVFLVGGTLILYPNSSPPMLAHWTPAFPAFYAAIAVPIGAWAVSARAMSREKFRWIPTAGAIAAALLLLAYANIHFYFFKYHADPETLKTERYKAAQRLYEEQTVQSRYMASLGSGYSVVVVGKSPYPYDADVTRYLVHGQPFIMVYDPQTALPLPSVAGGLAFLFFPGSEQYLDTIRQRYPNGSAAEVRNPAGRQLFQTYIVGSETVQQDAQPN